MAPSQTEVADIYNCSLLLICLPRKDERLSRPGWLTYSGRFTYIRLVTRRLQVGLLRRSDGGRGFICGRVVLFVRKREKNAYSCRYDKFKKISAMLNSESIRR